MKRSFLRSLVSLRRVCETNAEGYLTGVVERTAIERIDGDIQFIDENGKKVVLDENTPVSMNMWGFTPDYFAYSEEFFKDFLKKNMGNLKSEYFIPLMVNELITNGTARVIQHTTPQAVIIVALFRNRRLRSTLP